MITSPKVQFSRHLVDKPQALNYGTEDNFHLVAKFFPLESTMQKLKAGPTDRQSLYRIR